jgi:hypothetical protein
VNLTHKLTLTIVSLLGVILSIFSIAHVAKAVDYIPMEVNFISSTNWNWSDGTIDNNSINPIGSRFVQYLSNIVVNLTLPQDHNSPPSALQTSATAGRVSTTTVYLLLVVLVFTQLMLFSILAISTMSP